MKAYGLEPNISLTSFNYQEAMEDVISELDAHPHYDAVVGATDSIALAVHKYISEHYQQVKNQRIVGFGGDPVTEIVSPSISTVIYHFEQAGK